MLVVLDELASGTIALACDNESIAESELSGTILVSLAAQSGAYDNCSISVTGDTGNETGEIGSLTINPDPDEGYEGSQIANASADDQGSFSQSVTLPEVDQSEYAVLAVSSEGMAAVSALSVTSPPAVEAPAPNATGTLNETAPLPEGNVAVENQTEVRQTASTEPIVQLEETEAEPGEPLEGMFVTIYNADSGEKIEQGFTELTVEDLDPGAYPVFFANFRDLEFVSASPGDWVQTPFGGAGLVTIPDDGEDHDVVVTAVYERVTTTTQEPEFNKEAPLDIRGNIFTITPNETRPEGPFVMSGSFALSVEDEDPVRASLSAYIVSARDSSNEVVQLDSQRSRDHDTFQIMSFRPEVARPVGLDSYVVTGTADLLLNGDLYSNDEEIKVMVRGGEVLTPTNVEIEFQGDDRYSAANRLETLYGAVTTGFQ